MRRVKTCKAYSLEYEFSKKNIYLEKGTYSFWNHLMPDDTVIGRILENAKTALKEINSWISSENYFSNKELLTLMKFYLY